MSVVGDIYRITVNVSAPAASLVQNVYFFRHEGIAGVADATLVSAIGTYMGTLYGYIQAQMDSNVSVVDADIVRVNGLGEQTADLGSVTIGLSGSTAGSVMPAANALLLSVATGVTKVIARKYLGGMHVNTITEGLFNAAVLTAAGNFITNWLANF